MPVGIELHEIDAQIESLNKQQADAVKTIERAEGALQILRFQRGKVEAKIAARAEAVWKQAEEKNNAAAATTAVAAPPPPA